MINKIKGKVVDEQTKEKDFKDFLKHEFMNFFYNNKILHQNHLQGIETHSCNDNNDK